MTAVNSTTEIPCRIDYNNLCGGNDFAALTDNYSRAGIQRLIWSVPDDIVRQYVKDAIFLQKKIDKCETDEEFEELLEQQLHLNIRFKSTLYSLYALREHEDMVEKESMQNEEQNLISELKPIFYGDEEKAKEYIDHIKKIDNNTEKAQYTGQMVIDKFISSVSYKTPLWKILNKHKLYTPGANNWNKSLKKTV